MAEDASFRIVGFGLATQPGTGLKGDPPNAPVVGLLAVAPNAQGSNLLTAPRPGLALLGHDQSVLHVLADHHAAVIHRLSWSYTHE